MAELSQSVKVYIYELTKGLARSMSAALLGKQIEGVWHTGIVVYGQEFFYGGGGIESCRPGGTGIGAPDQIKDLGTTEIQFDMFMDYMKELAQSSYRGECYHLLDHNCNTFSNEIAQFLTGQSIPQHIINLPHEVMNSPFGAMMRPFLDSMSANPGGGCPLVPSAVASPVQTQSTTATAPKASSQAAISTPSSETPVKGIDFKDIEKVTSAYKAVCEKLKAGLSAADRTLCVETSEYLTAVEPDWGLSRSHINTIDKILRESTFTTEQKSAIGGLLQECLLHKDVVMMLLHDTTNTYTGILQLFEQHDTLVQLTLAKGLCNCASHDEGLTWLMSESGGIHTATLDVCRYCILHLDTDISLHGPGVALCANLTRNKVSSELAFDLGCAVVELLKKDLPTQTAEHGIISLCQCIDCNPEVAAIAIISGIDGALLASKYSTLKTLCDGRLQQCLSKCSM